MVARVLALAVGGLLIIAGIVWTLQGVGDIGGSFMSGDRTWTAIGLLTAVAGLVIAGFAGYGVLRRRRPAGRE